MPLCTCLKMHLSPRSRTEFEHEIMEDTARSCNPLKTIYTGMLHRIMHVSTRDDKYTYKYVLCLYDSLSLEV